MEVAIKIQLTINGKFYATGSWSIGTLHNAIMYVCERMYSQLCLSRIH